jgi:PAS domain S-box-containing protein
LVIPSLPDDRAFRRRLRRATGTLVAALLLPLLVLLGLVQFLLNSAHWVDHSDQVVSRATAVEKLLLGMQSGARGYRLLRDQESLATYTAARNEIGPALRGLSDFVSDNPRQVATLGQVQRDTATWIQAADSTIGRLEAGANVPLPSVPAARANLNLALTETQTFLAEETRLRTARSATLARIVTSLILLFGTAALVGLPVLAWWLQRLLRDVGASYQTSLQAVADSAHRFRLVAEMIALQVWTATLDGQLDYANPECVAYFGADLEPDILGNAWAQFVHPDDLPSVLQRWQAALASGERYETEFRLRRRDGTYRWFLVRAEAMRDAEDQIVKWFGTNTDVNDLKTAQDASERASRAKDSFLAALSHELRTPLTPVLMTAAALRNDGRLPAEVREQLGMIERNVALEARLIDDLLDLTAISRGKLALRAELCDAHTLIGLAIEIVAGEARAKGISLEPDLRARRGTLLVDPARFQQVIWNLLRNGVKFTPPGGRISIRTRDETTAAGATGFRLEVADSGIGIDPARLEQIFQPFDQGGLAGDHRFGGLGLGLVVARAVVDLHGGRIHAESAGPGRGATFIVELPEASAPSAGANGTAPGAASAPAHALPTAPQSLRLLVVEDHESTLQALVRLLQRDGHRVSSAASVTAALAAAAASPFDVVISDLGLPDGTGSDLMEQLRAAYGLRGIALSGYGMEEDLARSRAAGFVAHLVKPVHFGDLRRALASLPPA